MRSLMPSNLLSLATSFNATCFQGDEPAPSFVESGLGSSDRTSSTEKPAFSTQYARLDPVKPHKCQGTSSMGQKGLRVSHRSVFTTRCGRPATFGVVRTSHPPGRITRNVSRSSPKGSGTCSMTSQRLTTENRPGAKRADCIAKVTPEAIDAERARSPSRI